MATTDGWTCKYLVRDGICGGNLDVCCVYQNPRKHSILDREAWSELHGIRETWCNYPVVATDDMLTTAIHEIASRMQDAKEVITCVRDNPTDSKLDV